MKKDNIFERDNNTPLKVQEVTDTGVSLSKLERLCVYAISAMITAGILFYTSNGEVSKNESTKLEEGYEDESYSEGRIVTGEDGCDYLVPNGYDLVFIDGKPYGIKETVTHVVSTDDTGAKKCVTRHSYEKIDVSRVKAQGVHDVFKLM